MKTYKISTSLASNLGQGRMFLVQAEDEPQVLAWFAMNYGLAAIDPDSIAEATPEDVMYYQSTRGKIHQTNARQRQIVLNALDAIGSAEWDQALAKVDAERKNEPKNLVLFRSGDDTSWYAVNDAIFDQIDQYPSEGFQGSEFARFVNKLLFNADGDELPGVTQFHTQDFVTEKVSLVMVQRIVTLPSY